MNQPTFIWDFFLAHTGADTPLAEKLCDLLTNDSNVFLDSRVLLPGDIWGQELTQAQRSSRITVVIVSPRADQAFYQQEEIAAAIALARHDKTKHRVVPLFVTGAPSPESVVPYGLRSLHSIYIHDEESLTQAAQRLLNLLSYVRSLPAGEESNRLLVSEPRHVAEVGVSNLKVTSSHTLLGFVHEFKFDLRTVHRIKFQGTHHLWGMTKLGLVLDGDEIYSRTINQVYQSVYHNFRIENINCLFKFKIIAGTTSGGLWIGEQQIMKVTNFQP
jgi:hypothetical protein